MLGYMCGIRRRRGLEEIFARKKGLFSVTIVDELNFLSSIGHFLYTNHTLHRVFVLGITLLCFVTFSNALKWVILVCRGILVLGGWVVVFSWGLVGWLIVFLSMIG